MALQSIMPLSVSPAISMADELQSEMCALPQQGPSLPASSELSIRSMSISELAAHCTHEIAMYRRGEALDDQYCQELLDRAIVRRDPLAWEAMQQCFFETVLRWLRNHPQREVAYRLDSEENYVAQAFTRFWVATVSNQARELRTVAAALTYLRMCLHSLILDTLRTYTRSREVPLPEPDEPGEPAIYDDIDVQELWSIIQSLLADEREQRVAYLLYQAGLKPRQIIQFCPQEFSDIREIYRLSRNIMERLMRRADFLRWQLGD